MQSLYRSFTGYHFNETVFLSLGGDKNVNVPVERCEFAWTLCTMSHSIPISHTSVISKCDEF